MDERSSLGTASKRGRFFRNARARNTHVEATLNLSFAAQVHAADLATFLDLEGVACRAGHHCTQPLHARLGAPGGSVRASLALYNTADEVDAFLAALARVLDDFDGAGDDDFVPLDLGAL